MNSSKLDVVVKLTCRMLLLYRTGQKKKKRNCFISEGKQLRQITLQFKMSDMYKIGIVTANHVQSSVYGIFYSA